MAGLTFLRILATGSREPEDAKGPGSIGVNEPQMNADERGLQAVFL